MSTIKWAIFLESPVVIQSAFNFDYNSISPVNNVQPYFSFPERAHEEGGAMGMYDQPV